jgi:hypothetical protein
MRAGNRDWLAMSAGEGRVPRRWMACAVSGWAGTREHVTRTLARPTAARNCIIDEASPFLEVLPRIGPESARERPGAELSLTLESTRSRIEVSCDVSCIELESACDIWKGLEGLVRSCQQQQCSAAVARGLGSLVRYARA